MAGGVSRQPQFLVEGPASSFVLWTQFALKLPLSWRTVKHFFLVSGVQDTARTEINSVLRGTGTLLISVGPETKGKNYWDTVNFGANSIQILKQRLETETETELDRNHGLVTIYLRESSGRSKGGGARDTSPHLWTKISSFSCSLP